VNILLVNWQDVRNPQAGGAEIHLFEIFSRLAARGHRVRLVCSNWVGGEVQETVQGIEVHRVGGRHSFALKARAAVRRALRTERTDIVCEDINKLPLFLAGMTPLPFCAIIPHLFGSTAFEEASWPMAATVWLAEQPIALAYRRAGFHAISESTRDDLARRGVDPGRIRVIHPGVDCVRYHPDPAVGRTTDPTFVYVGRLKRYKKVTVAIQALALARKERPDLRLDIAGGGDHLAELRQLAADVGQAEAVRFLGFVSEAEKVRLFRSAWANVFPSPKEGWGITVMEAAACGTPSIASDSPGLRDSVRAGVTGWLVPHGDAAALARQYLALAADRALVDRFGLAARRHAERLTWDAAASQTEAQLQELVSHADFR
jgi:glycosyltransferase involved in cell wall biosynthesis